MDEEYPDQGAEHEGQNPGSGYQGAGQTVISYPSTGDDRVDEAVAGVGRLPGRPVDEHVAVFEEVHGRLRDILGEVNDEPAKGQSQSQH
jgi:hypothetical protein